MTRLVEFKFEEKMKDSQRDRLTNAVLEGVSEALQRGYGQFLLEVDGGVVTLDKMTSYKERFFKC